MIVATVAVTHSCVNPSFSVSPAFLCSDNTCTEDACPCGASTGYYAAPGYDATTGLGTINYGKLQAAMASMGL